MNEYRWIDRSQPQRLVQGTMMLYWTAAFDVLNGLLTIGGLGLIFLIIAAAKVAGGYGIANEKKAGYYAGTGAAIASLVLAVILLRNSPVFGLLGVAIDAWVLSMLLHESSRGYQRIWFK
ncbi:MAG TPA: hypothetical protein VF183_13750 [Acidimicrobiales bacterium]